jgi:hypothetical protein
MRLLFVLLTTVVCSFAFAQDAAAQDVKVATWSTGAIDTDKYESFSFWIKSGKRAYIRCVHGTSPDDIELRWLGPGTNNGRRGFWAAFPAPDKRTVFICPLNDSTLLITTRNESRKFYWDDENANPGSDCDICADNAAEATGWLRRFFWN